ncbi:MAG: LysR substrate-binding domain-containing protein [Humibacillus sp.]
MPPPRPPDAHWHGRPTARLPDLDSVALLVAVAASGSLSRAARLQGISQPSASARIEALERRLGLQLLVRSTRGSELTPAGQLVLAWAKGVLTSVEELMQGVEALSQRRSAELTVAASLSIAEYLMPPWLVRLHLEQPGIAVRLQVANSTDVIAAVLDGEVLVGFVEGPTVPRSLAWTQVGTDRLLVVVGAGHPWARRATPVPLAEFLATPLLLREPGSGSRQTLERAVGGPGALLPPALQLSTTTAILGAAVGGSAPAVLSELTVRADVQAGHLVRVPVTGLTLRRRLRAVWRRGVVLDGPARALVEMAQASAVTATDADRRAASGG